jgi:hypothetical protein
MFGVWYFTSGDELPIYQKLTAFIQQGRGQTWNKREYISLQFYGHFIETLSIFSKNVM